ncbi:NADPH-dependent F420 reductase [Paenibacillus chartarius]|uniref:NADPH-dependent F420 reductase n=1 Tax=Paenibacillus chartarius TaxID=747481 RepID=A0ABV6DSA6_9BACL
MKIAVLGTGHMGKALVRTLAPHHTNVVWGSRTPAEAAKLAEEWGLKQVAAVTYEEALAADVLIPAFKFCDILNWAEANKEQLKGKTVIDISNPFNSDFSGFTMEWGASAAEAVQSAIPDSNVVGAFKNTFFQVFAEPTFEGRISDVLVTGDDEAVRARIIALLEPLPFRFIDAGKLANNRTIERFTLLELEIASRYKTYPYISVQIFGVASVGAAVNA